MSFTVTQEMVEVRVTGGAWVPYGVTLNSVRTPRAPAPVATPSRRERHPLSQRHRFGGCLPDGRAAGSHAPPD
jgi:hypothetical protein